jgi:hypothetical protein
MLYQGLKNFPRWLSPQYHQEIFLVDYLSNTIKSFFHCFYIFLTIVIMYQFIVYVACDTVLTIEGASW